MVVENLNPQALAANSGLERPNIPRYVQLRRAVRGLKRDIPGRGELAAALSAIAACRSASEISTLRTLLDGMGSDDAYDTTEEWRQADVDNDAPSAMTPSWLMMVNGLPRVDPALFTSAAYRKRWQDGGYANAYCAGCTGAAALSRTLGRPIFKVGLTRRESLQHRMLMLRAECYGSCAMVDGRWLQQPGWQNWRAMMLGGDDGRAENSPVRISRYAAELRLPAGLTASMAERAIADRMLQTSLLTDISHRPQGFNREQFVRFTPRRQKGGTKYVAVHELVIIAPSTEACDLADVVEAVIAEFVMIQPVGVAE